MPELHAEEGQDVEWTGESPEKTIRVDMEDVDHTPRPPITLIEVRMEEYGYIVPGFARPFRTLTQALRAING